MTSNGEHTLPNKLTKVKKILSQKTNNSPTEKAESVENHTVPSKALDDKAGDKWWEDKWWKTTQRQIQKKTERQIDDNLIKVFGDAQNTTNHCKKTVENTAAPSGSVDESKTTTDTVENALLEEPKAEETKPTITNVTTETDSKTGNETEPDTAEKKWFVIGGTVIGQSHIDSQLPCQDSHYYKEIANGWGIAIVADGAGSAANSHLGSEFVAKTAAQAFNQLVTNQEWHIKNQLPSENNWHVLATETLKTVRMTLENYATQKKLESKSLACTVIIVIYSPIGILITHIGDGRAAYCNLSNEWKPMMRPWKGEEANATVFMTSAIWNNKEINPFIESRVINERPLAFTLMSDGCEKASFECSQFESSTNKWSDPNNPYPKFFQPLVNTLKNLEKAGTPVDEVQAKWQHFLNNGNQTLTDEPDDKTMVLGVLIECELGNG
ncbi:MAG: hypothetical protein DRR19_03850 [Candidatus Parabeggiatoa sp. nov. 1]|nr:MAG: hypothetical protein DRR19_03850 [Gammaproteobacteria bacterium]